MMKMTLLIENVVMLIIEIQVVILLARQIKKKNN